MSDRHRNKQIVRDFIRVVWYERNLDALSDFWTEDCLNHAMPRPYHRGLDALRAYHDSFFANFSAFSSIQIAIVQQVAEGDRVVSYITTQGEHTRAFYGIPATGRLVSTIGNADRSHSSQ